jgi:Domain of unknown function (DUF5710)
MAREWLDVPFSEKDRAKACGARWDPAAGRWYAPRPGIPGLERWEPLSDLLPGEDRTFGSVLMVDPIPSTTWFHNARTCIAPGDWQRVRMLVLRRAGYRCEACGRPGVGGQGLECHERWDYDERSQRQTLRRLICFCISCHTVTHFGLAQIRGKDAAAVAHLRDVTGMSDAEADQHIRAAIALWQHRSGIAWQIDLSILTRAGIGFAPPGSAHTPPPRDAARARILTEPPPPRQPPVTIANRPRNPELGSRWERWLKTGER